MSVEFNLANLIFVVIALFSGGWALLKIIAIQFERGLKRDLQEQFRLQEVASKAHYLQLNTRLDVLDSAVKADAGQWQRVERELLNLKAELPLHYVRREDYVLAIASILVKLDSAQMRHENLLLKGLRHE